MPLTILLTAFGPFPGAPVNPTGPLVAFLAGRSRAGERRVAHVFATRYDAVDRALPDLVAHHRPAALVMFGLATWARRIRIETRARNVLSQTHADAGGHLPMDHAITPDGPLHRTLHAGPRLVAAARRTGAPARLSGDAGSYLCNYLCWRASEAAHHADGLRLVTFVHIPMVRLTWLRRAPHGSAPMTLGDLVPACEAIVQAAVAAARIRR
jgi:pyroglutamyl-peptidase